MHTADSTSTRTHAITTNPAPSHLRRGVAFAIIAAVAWGTGGVGAAILYRDTGLGPVATSFWRIAVGALVLAAWYAVIGSRRRPAGGRQGFLVAVTGVGLALYQTAYYAAVAAAGVGFATVVTLGSAPVLVALGARFAAGERLGARGRAALAVAPIGLLLVVGGAGGGSLRGTALALVSAAGYAGVTVLTRTAGGDPQWTTGAGSAIAAACLAPLAVVEGLLPQRGSTVEAVLVIAYLGVVSSALAYWLYFASLATVRATTVSVLTLAEPVAAAALGVLLLAERLEWTMAAGATVLLGAIVLLARSEVSRPGST